MRLLQQVDRRLGLTEAVARTLEDPRRQASCDHDRLSLLRQRVYALALGYEDLDDHETLRLDLAIQTALGRTQELASSSTLCRWEKGKGHFRSVRHKQGDTVRGLYAGGLQRACDGKNLLSQPLVSECRA